MKTIVFKFCIILQLLQKAYKICLNTNYEPDFPYFALFTDLMVSQNDLLMETYIFRLPHLAERTTFFEVSKVALDVKRLSGFVVEKKY